MWYAGIDWADQHHDAVVIDEDGKRVATRRVPHTAAGLAQLTAFLQGVGDVAAHPEHLACIIETSHGLLIHALLDAGLPVYPVNPKTVDRRRKPSGAKTDAIDAYLLARTGRSDLVDLRPLTPDSPLVAELKLGGDNDSCNLGPFCRHAAGAPHRLPVVKAGRSYSRGRGSRATSNV
jgi:transposase